jgi:glycosyltransferase domain-containing protein
MIDLSDLTLVIPAYNRPAYLARQVDYWANTGVQLCILDGSKEKVPDDLIARMGTNVHYEYMPIGFNERLVYASQIVKTKYVALLGDDELYAKQGLLDCLNTLESDPRLIGCVGRSLYFFYRDSEIYAHQVYEKSEDLPLMYGDHIERLKSSFPDGDPTSAPYLLYGVFHKEVWSIMFGSSYNRHYSSGYVYEVALTIIGACLGPTKMVDSLVWFRSGENPAMSSSAVNRKIGIGEWGTSNDFKFEYEDFIHRIVNVLSERGVGSRNELDQTIRDLSEQFFSYHLHKPYRPIAYWHRALYFVARNTPRWAKTLLKRNMTKTLGVVLDYKGVVFNDALEDLKKNGVSFSDEEMKETRSFLLDFHSQLKSD